MNIFNKLMYHPGGENESGTGNSSVEAQNDLIPDGVNKAEVKEHKTIMEKIKEALHDWSNKDEQDQAFDDTRV